jgi:hypothetical protein
MGGDGSPFGSGLIKASDMPAAKPISRLWFGLYPSSVTLLNGETGAGKSVILLTLAVHAALNLPLWGIPFGADRALRVLYIDPENAGNWREGDGGVVAQRMERLGLGRPEHLLFHDGKDLDLSRADHMADLTQLVSEREIDIIILDPLVEVFQTANENDNMEASGQMKALRLLSRETGASVVLCHHTGKLGEENGGSSGKFGRGASSRLGAADVGMTLRVKPAGDDGDADDGSADTRPRHRKDICRLKIEKNRPGSEYDSLFLRMVGDDKFELTTAAAFAGKSTKSATDVKSDRAKTLVQQLLADGREHSRQKIAEHVKQTGIGRPAIDAMLREMEAGGIIVMCKGPHNAFNYRLSQFPVCS